MNSLTTVGGTVVDAEEMDVIDQTKSRRRMRRVRSVDDQNHHNGNDSDSIDAPLRPAMLARHRSAPTSRTAVATATIDDKNGRLDLRPPRPEHSDCISAGSVRGTRRLSSPRSSLSNRTRARTTTASSSITGPREPTGTSTVSQPAVLNQDSSGVVSRKNSFDATPPPSALISPKVVLSAAAIATKQAILTTLNTVSRSKSYASSPYFQRIFSQGIANIERYDRELRDVEEALRMCFDVNGDMLHVIASAAADQERNIARPFDSDKKIIIGGGVTADATSVRERGTSTKPWEEPRHKGMEAKVMIGQTRAATPYTYNQQHRPWSEPRNGKRRADFSSPSDLSGYTRSEGSLAVIPGTVIEYTAQVTGHNAVQRTPPPDEVDVASRPFLHDNPNNLAGMAPASAQKAITPQEIQEEQKSLHRKEKARQRVHQYLTQIDDRIHQIRHQGKNSNDGGVVEQVRSHELLKGSSGTSISHHNIQHQQVQPCNEFDAGAVQHSSNNKTEIEKGNSQAMKQRLLLPSLETPGGSWGQQQEQQKKIFRQQQPERGFSSLSSGVHVTIPEDVGTAEARPAANVARSSRPADDSNTNIPRDREEDAGHHSNESCTMVLAPPRDAHLQGPTSSNSFINNSSVSAKEEQIMVLEKSLGLKSLKDYRELLKEKMLEIASLEETFQIQMRQNKHEAEVREDEIRQFKIALNEAERAIKALEETIYQLEEASKEKDELIRKLQARIKELELQLSKNGDFGRQKELEHREHVQMLNERISQMNVAIKEKSGSLSSLRIKTRNIESELATTLATMSSYQNTLVIQSKKLETSEQELILAKKMLTDQTNLYKNEIASSLENTTQLMDLVAKEKDNLINSLNAKICVLEKSLKEMEDEVDEGALLGKEKERESMEKSRALQEKDQQIEALQKAMAQSNIEKSNKKTQTHSNKTKNAKTQTPKIRKTTNIGSRRDGSEYYSGNDSEIVDRTSSRRTTYSRQRNKEKQLARSRSKGRRNQNHHHPQNQKAKKEPPACQASEYYKSQQQIAAQGMRIYHDEARDDELTHHDGVSSCSRHGQLIVHYRSKSADGDSIFDFSS